MAHAEKRVWGVYGTEARTDRDRIRLRAADTKTKASRLVCITEDMAWELRALVASKRMPDAFRLRKQFKSAVRTCGYSEELCLHSLRHTRATRLLEAGVTATVVMQIMGWKSFDVMKRYSHVSDTLQREAAEKVSLRRGESATESPVLPFAPAVKSAG